MPKILLVEDDISIATIYKMKLELHKHTVIHALNGLEGLKHAKEKKPDLVLLDLMMPVMNGATFLEKFRSNTEFSSIPVLVLTNLSREEAPKTLWHFGISGYFVKANHTPNELIEIIERTLSDS